MRPRFCTLAIWRAFRKGSISRALVASRLVVVVLIGSTVVSLLAKPASAATIPAPNGTDWQLNGPQAAIQGDGSLLLTTASGGSQAASAFYTTALGSDSIT